VIQLFRVKLAHDVRMNSVVPFVRQANRADPHNELPRVKLRFLHVPREQTSLNFRRGFDEYEKDSDQRASRLFRRLNGLVAQSLLKVSGRALLPKVVSANTKARPFIHGRGT
jgi:hypothetical protein